MTHGAVPVWEYHATHYDDAGNVRVSPAKTTFALTKSKEIQPAFSPDAILDDTDPWNIKGNAEIYFYYRTDAEKAWFDNIAATGALALVSYDESKGTLNDALNYSIESGMTYEGQTVGKLTIPLGQTNFYSNGRYYVRVTSGDTAQLVPIHVVNSTAPELELKETAVSGKNLHFTVKHMTYGITVPIETVTLTDPTGETRELRKIDDWYLLGDTFVLYNDVHAENGRNHLPYNGNYTITLYSNGFQTVSKTFAVSGGADVATGATKVMRMARGSSYDAVTHATGSGGSSGGSVNMTADLLFDSDLVANAMILEQLQKETEDVTAVLDYWYSVGYDSVFQKGAATYYTWTGYLNAVNDAKVSGALWAPFEHYMESGEVTLNRPYAVKEVLEDGLLGDVQYSGSYGRLEAPAFVITQNEQGKDVVLKCGDTAYLEQITEIYLDGDWRPMKQDLYTVDAEAGTLTMKQSAFTYGEETTLLIDATGYRSNEVIFTYGKTSEGELFLAPAIAGFTLTKDVNPINDDFYRITFQGVTGTLLTDYLNAITKITVNGEEYTKWSHKTWFFNDEKAYKFGVLDGSYNTTDHLTSAFDCLDITTDIFEADVQEANIMIEATGYQTLQYRAQKAEEGGEEPETKAAPTIEAFTYQEGGFLQDPYYRMTFETLSGADLTTYLNAVQTVTVASKEEEKIEYEKTDFSFRGDTNCFKLSVTDDSGSLSEYDCMDFTADTVFAGGNYTICIQAAGYEDLTYTYGGLEGGEEPETKAAPTIEAFMYQEGGFLQAPYYRMTFETLSGADLTTYLNAVQTVTVASKEEEKIEYEKTDFSFRGDTNCFKLSVTDDSGSLSEYDCMDFTADTVFAGGNYTICIQAAGYEDLTYTAEDSEDAGEEANRPEVGNFEWDRTERCFLLTFRNMEAEALTEYLNAIRKVTVDGTEYQEAWSTFSLRAGEYALNDTTGNPYGENLLDSICFPSAMFPATERSVTIVIEAEGYDTLTYEASSY